MDCINTPVFVSPIPISSTDVRAALTLYSAVFMRFAWKVQPRNLLLLGCHVVNFTVQTTQGVRFIKYNYLGGHKTAALADKKSAPVAAQ